MVFEMCKVGYPMQMRNIDADAVKNTSLQDFEVFQVHISLLRL